MAFWWTTSGYEVDFVAGDHTAVEGKGKTHVGPHDLRSLRALGNEARFTRHVRVCLETRPRVVDGIEVLPLEAFLDALWGGEHR